MSVGILFRPCGGTRTSDIGNIRCVWVFCLGSVVVLVPQIGNIR